MSWQNAQQFISKQGLQMNSPYTDGFTSWEIKKKMYDLKDTVDRIMAEASTYAEEEEWLAERNLKKAFDKLGNR